MLGYQGGLRVVENDALFAIEPALRLVDLSDNGVQSEGEDAVSQRPVRGIEGHSLPPKSIDQGRDWLAKLRVRSDDGGPLSFAVGDVAGRTIREKIVEFLLGHRQKLRRSVCHVGISSVRRRRVLGDSAVIGFWKAPRENVAHYGGRADFCQ